MRRGPSNLEETLALQIQALKLPEPRREYRFCVSRRFRFDFAWPSVGLAVECEGGHWIRGRHVRGGGFENDCEKYNLAALMGWRVLRYTGKMVKSGKALEQIEKILKGGLMAERGGPLIREVGF